MKQIIILLLVFTISCKKETQTSPKPKETTSKTEVAKKSTSKLLGTYVGRFIASNKNPNDSYSISNKINITINQITSDSIFGFSVVSGNKRPFKGKKHQKSMITNVYEPGDNPYDGRFEFSISEKNGHLIGKWYANNNSLIINERYYDLESAFFSYNKDQVLLEYIEFTDLYNEDLEEENKFKEEENKRLEEDYEITGEDYQYEEILHEFLTEDVLKFNASNTLLNEEDIANFSKGDLQVLRNSIFARHGYSFKTKKMRYIFDNIEWYIPVSTDVRNELTEIEEKNIELIKRFEEHAERYYDSFGR